MRQNFPRRRITLDPIRDASPRDWFFRLRPGPIAEAHHYWRFGQMLIRHALISTVLIFVPILFPMTRYTLLFFYLPMFGALISRFLGEVTYASRTAVTVAYVLLVISCVRLAHKLPESPIATVVEEKPDSIGSYTQQTYNWKQGWTVIVFLAAPFVFNWASSLTPVQSLQFGTLFGFLALISAVCMLRMDLPFSMSWLPNRFALLLVPTAIVYGRTIVATYSCRLAASPHVSFEASMALGASANRGSALPRPARIPESIVDSPVYQSLLFGLSVTIGCLIAQDPTFLVPPLVWPLAAMQGLLCWPALSIFMRAADGAKPFNRAIKLTLGSFFQSLALWETDQHPADYAPGVYAASKLDVGGLPVRRGLTWALGMLTFFTFAYAHGQKEFAYLAVKILSTSLFDLPFLLFAVIGVTEFCFLLTVFVTFWPAILRARLIAEGVIKTEAGR